MKIKRVVWFFVGLAWWIGAGELAGQGKVIRPLPERRPPVSLLPCADIQVLSLQASLISTQAGSTSVEFPQDSVRLEATLTNVGNLALPPGTALHIEWRRNGQAFSTSDPVGMLGAPGSRWTVTLTDAFPHNSPTTYTILVGTTVRECSTTNNQAVCAIDESRLHGGGSGAPDLTCSVFKVEKRWQQEGDHFKGTCFFSAQVANVGSGYCRNDSQPVQLTFHQEKQNQLAVVTIPEAELPAPGYNKVYSVEVPDAQVPFGEYAVYARIGAVRNESATGNNWSVNAARLTNSPDQPTKAMVKIAFRPWGMLGRVLNIGIEIRSMQYQPLHNVRLVLLRNDTIIKEWRSLEIAPAAAFRKSTVYDRPEVENTTGRDNFRAILTTDNGQGLPVESTILDSQTKPLCWMDMADSLLQVLLQDPQNGIGAKLHADDKDITIHDNKTRVQTSPESMYIFVEGDKRIKGGAHVGFRAHVWLKVHARHGKIAADIIKKDLDIGSRATEIILSIVIPGIGLAILEGIEKSFRSAIPDDFGFGVGGVSPCGIVLRQGALYLYYPYTGD